MQKKLLNCLLFLLWFAHLAMAQKLTSHLAQTFSNNDYQLKIADRDIVVIKYVNKGKDPSSITASHIFATPANFHNAGSTIRQAAFALPGYSRADAYVIITIPKGTTYYEGPCAGGVMCTFKNPQHTAFFPYHKYKSEADLERAISHYQKNINGTGFERQEHVGRAPQIVIPKENATKVVVNSNQAIPLHDTYAYQYYNAYTQGHRPPPRPANDNNPPPPPPPPAPRINVQSTHNQQHIQPVIQHYNAFPGGIIVEPQGQFERTFSAAQYDKATNQLVLDGRYRYDAGLNPEELATVMQAAYLSADGRFGAVSQSDFAGMPADGVAAFDLGQADRFLGTIAYGYDCEGFAPMYYETAKGYVNPLDAEMKTLASGNREQIHRFLLNEMKGLQPRLFLNYRSVQFKIDPKTSYLYPTDLDLKIQYQVFYTENNKDYDFVKDAPEKYFPHVVAAIKHFEKNYAAYENRQPFLQKARLIAEAYAFFRALKNAGVKIGGLSELRLALEKRLPVSIVLNDYNDIGENAKLRQYWQQSMESLEKLSLQGATNLQKLALNHFLLRQSLNLKDTERILRYRKNCLDLAKVVFPKKGKLKELDKDYQWYLSAVKNSLPIEVNGQISFARKYAKTNIAVHKKNLEKALNWLNIQVGNEANYELHSWLFSLNQSYGDTTLARKHERQWYALMEKDASLSDARAQYYIGSAYYDGYLRPKDQKKGAEWLIKAAENGEMKAQNLVGVLYMKQGKNDPQKLKSALALVRQSADQGYYMAQYNLGYYYENGLVTGKPDLAKAKMWYKKSAEQGYEEAKKRLVALGN